jgi:hypothetical protein
MSRIPDTEVRVFVDYYRSLNHSEQDALADAVTYVGSARAFPALWEMPEYEAVKANPAWVRWRQLKFSRRMHVQSLRYVGAMEARNWMELARLERATGKPVSVPRALEEYGESLHVVMAPERRKRVRDVLRQLMAAEAKSQGDGQWDYVGVIGGVDVTVHTRFSKRLVQLDYNVAVQSRSPAVSFEGLSFDAVLCDGIGWWDFIVDENLDDAMDLFRDLVRWVAELPRRLPEGCLDAQRR